MKKLLCIILSVLMLIGSFSVFAYAAPANGWYKSDGVWYYYVDSKKVKGWKKISGKWYYFSDNAEMCTGLQLIDKQYFFFNNGGAMQSGGWVKSVEIWNGEKYVSWYYAGNDGILSVGWKTVDGKTYYLEPEMVYGGGRKIRGGVYVFNNSGEWVKTEGFVKITKKVSGEIKETGMYYIEGDGTAKTGWYDEDEKTYFFDTNTGKMYSNGGFIIVADGEAKPYVFESDGAKTTRTGWLSFTVDGVKEWYYVKRVSVAETGWIKTGGKNYFLDRTGLMQKGVVNTGNGVYYLNSSGALNSDKNGWVKDDGDWYYFKSGKALTGWQTVGGKKYYFSSSTAIMYSNGVYSISGKNYYFAPSGASTGTAL